MTAAEHFGLAPPGRAAPEWRIERWYNCPASLRLPDLRGKVVVLHTFQMLCPGCVQHGLPQASRIHALFAHEDVAVIGLHTVFEHHAAMTPVSLEAFLHEYRITFPVGVDQASDTPGDPLPKTMRAYATRGTPSLLLIDRNGDLRHHAFGAEEDIAVGARIAALIKE
jgi:peroxiredoxin